MIDQLIQFLEQIPIFVYLIVFVFLLIWVVRFIIKHVVSGLLFIGFVLLLLVAALTIFRLMN